MKPARVPLQGAPAVAVVEDPGVGVDTAVAEAAVAVGVEDMVAAAVAAGAVPGSHCQSLNI